MLSISSKNEVLGPYLSKEGIHPMNKLLQRIRSTRHPQNKNHVKGFLGQVGYYQKFIPNFTELIVALQKILSKEALVSWGDEQEKACIKLRNLLTEDSFLMYPDPSSPFYLGTHASDVGMGAVILQKRNSELRPIQFASKRFSVSQRKYSSPQRECLAVILGIERFHYHLNGINSFC
jgi:hypothetical protein